MLYHKVKFEINARYTIAVMLVQLMDSRSDALYWHFSLGKPCSSMRFLTNFVFKIMLVWISFLFLSVFCICLPQCHLSHSLLEILWVPLVKTKLKDPFCSDDYLLISIATACPRSFEIILLKRPLNYLYPYGNQFGFKANLDWTLCLPY